MQESAHMKPRIDLLSDTVTLPSLEMRRRMAEAEVGYAQYGEDPTVNALQQRVAKILGTEAALFLPSGIMCNQIAVHLHCRPGDEIIADSSCHVWNFEHGGAAVLSGATFRPIEGVNGIFDGPALAAALDGKSRYAPPSRLLVAEQSTSCGAVWPLETLRAVRDLAHDRGMLCHLDGARLFNASVSSGIAPSAYCEGFDSVWIDFSKGLGAPVGAALAGSRTLIERAWLLKRMFGGAMRQAGIIAAGGLYALEHNIERLREDHENAKILASALREVPGLEVLPTETNIVIFRLSSSRSDVPAFLDTLRSRGLRLADLGGRRIRAVTHLDVSRKDIEEAAAILCDALRSQADL